MPDVSERNGPHELQIGGHMKRIAAVTAITAALAAPFSFASEALATNVAASIGGTGFAVSAGQPGLWGPARGCFNCGWNRTWIPPVSAAPVFLPAPVFASFLAPSFVVAPVVVRPRRVFVPAPVFRPRVIVAGGYWPR
jgi:hypothetical protein